MIHLVKSGLALSVSVCDLFRNRLSLCTIPPELPHLQSFGDVLRRDDFE